MKSFAFPIFPFILLYAVRRYFLFITKCCFLEPDTQRGFYSHDGNWGPLSVYTRHLGWLSCVLQCCLPSSLRFLDTHTFKEVTFASQVSQTVICDIFQKSLGDWRATLTKSIQRTCDPTYSSESKIYLTSMSKGDLFLPLTPKLAWHGLCYFGFYPIFGERNMRNYQTQVYP